MNNTTFPASLHLRVGNHKRLVAGAKLCGNAIMQRMFWNLLIAAFDPIDSVRGKIQNNVRRMVCKVHRG